MTNNRVVATILASGIVVAGIAVGTAWAGGPGGAKRKGEGGAGRL